MCIIIEPHHTIGATTAVLLMVSITQIFYLKIRGKKTLTSLEVEKRDKAHVKILTTSE
jgi:hypothetical protein